MDFQSPTSYSRQSRYGCGDVPRGCMLAALLQPGIDKAWEFIDEQSKGEGSGYSAASRRARSLPANSHLRRVRSSHQGRRKRSSSALFIPKPYWLDIKLFARLSRGRMTITPVACPVATDTQLSSRTQLLKETNAGSSTYGAQYESSLKPHATLFSEAFLILGPVRHCRSNV